MTDLIFGRSSDDRLVAEAELDGADPDEVISDAAAVGAELLWIHSNTDLEERGFQRRNGYVRLHADSIPTGSALPQVPAADFSELTNEAFRGLWGHKHVDQDALPPEHAEIVGLRRDGRIVGLCSVFPSARLIDGPGLIPRHRSVSNYVRLLLGACARLGSGPADIDSWGDSRNVIAAYVRLGFQPIEQIAGWELDLTMPR